MKGSVRGEYFIVRQKGAARMRVAWIPFDWISCVGKGGRGRGSRAPYEGETWHIARCRALPWIGR